MRKKAEIENYMEEAFDKVWYCQTTECKNPEAEQRRLAAVKRIEEQYGKDLSKLCDLSTGDWEYGYVSS